MVTIRASEQGLLKIDCARRHKGWLKQSEIWCRTAHTSRATLKRFWRREPIERGNFIAICQAVGIGNWEAISQLEAHPSNTYLCLQAMPDVPIWFGRNLELAQLTDWANECRTIAIWGMGGIGKTALVAEWVESILRSGVARQFSAIFWRSLRYSPKLESLTATPISALDTPDILTTCQQHRCLLILDNWETLLGGGSAGEVRAEYAGFSWLLQQLATTRHDSCAIAIGREKPAELAQLEGINPLVRSHQLQGLEREDAIALLQYRGLQPEPTAWETLIRLYRGHPLALNALASLIQDMFQGSTQEFLKLNTLVIHQLENVLADRIQCLATSELAVLKLLARTGRPVSREWLQIKLEGTSQSQLIEILRSLEGRCLLEISSEETVLFGLTPVVHKYINKNL